MIKTIGHVALDCYNYDQTLDFYTRVLGFEKMFDLHGDAGQVWLTYLRVSDENFIEIYPKSGEKPENRGSFSHLCLEVADIEITLKEMENHGIAIDSGPSTGKDGNRQAWIKDPEGNRIEFMQMMPDSLQMRAIERIKATKIAA